MERGVIHNRERSRQIKNFSGLRYGTITPTDLDGLIDFGNKAFIYLELKCIGVEIERGQELAMERIVDDHAVKSVGILATHDTYVHEDIDAANCIVSRVRFNKRWFDFDGTVTVRQIIDRFLSKHAPEYLNGTV